MHFNLHADYVKATAHPHTRSGGRATHEARRSQPPPRPVRALVARTLVSVAAAMDDESVQRAKAA